MPPKKNAKKVATCDDASSLHSMHDGADRTQQTCGALARVLCMVSALPPSSNVTEAQTYLRYGNDYIGHHCTGNGHMSLNYMGP